MYWSGSMALDKTEGKEYFSFFLFLEKIILKYFEEGGEIEGSM